MPRLKMGLLFFPCLGALFGAGCSDSPPPGATTGDGGNASAEAGGTTTTVSFGADVMPILQRSCSTGGTACHGASAVATQDGIRRPYLGPAIPASLSPVGSAANAALLNALVGVNASADPSMPEITAHNPGQSFLMHKVDGALTGLSCASGDLASHTCGDPMPNGSPLGQSDLDKIRTWITEGASNN